MYANYSSIVADLRLGAAHGFPNLKTLVEPISTLPGERETLLLQQARLSRSQGSLLHCYHGAPHNDALDVGLPYSDRSDDE